MEEQTDSKAVKAMGGNRIFTNCDLFFLLNFCSLRILSLFYFLLVCLFQLLFQDENNEISKYSSREKVSCYFNL